MRDCLIERKDYREFLGEMQPKSADLILTDPPYAISRKTGIANTSLKKYEGFSMEFGQWDSKEVDLRHLSDLMYRALRKGGTAIVWYDIWKISHLRDALDASGFKMIRLIIWEKMNPVPLNSKLLYLSNSREMAVLAVKVGKPTFHSKYDNGIYRHPIPRPVGGRSHPTQKPEKLFLELVEKHSNPGDLVVDPFLGSGTTAAAAMRSGRRFAGCDIDQDYVQSSIERCRNEVTDD